MKKRKTKTTRSPKQQWHSEREFSVQGVLKACETKLRNIANLDSTILAERTQLKDIALNIQYLAMDMKEADEVSWKLWQQRKGL
jgi:hypothetical protein